MPHLGQTGLAVLWRKCKTHFGATLSVSGTTITLKNEADTPDILSQASIPNATAESAGAMSAADKLKLDGVAAGANNTVVDTSLSTTSANPVQNKVVKAALDGKLATGGTASKLATARTLSLSGDVTGSATFDGSVNASIKAAVRGMTDAEIEAACPAPSGSEEAAYEGEPVGKWALMDPGVSPAEKFGGSWTKRTDTYLFMGYKIWERVS